MGVIKLWTVLFCDLGVLLLLSLWSVIYFFSLKNVPWTFLSLTRKKGLFNWDTEISLKACQVHNYQAGIRPQKRRRKSNKLKTSHVRRWRNNNRERSCTEMQCLVKMSLIHSQAQHKLFIRHSSELFTYFMHLSNTKYIYWFLFFSVTKMFN